jgi:hypothetical protein
LFWLFGAFYCDWILAAIAENWAGLPSSDIAFLYWIYFAAKRMPMLSTWFLYYNNTSHLMLCVTIKYIARTSVLKIMIMINF